jgi:alkanesulfonate monooxygenase SsuD/methylene tetrahydromethanopterin reductase-like flavin-dependent oxidoreductase (luciferase family)
MLAEGLEVLAALWSGEPVSHHGTHYHVDSEPFAQPTQRPRIPVWVGGTWPSKKPFRRAGKWDGVMPIPLYVEHLGQENPRRFGVTYGRATSTKGSR